MKTFFLVLIFTAAAVAGPQSLDGETYISKKNAFENRYAAVSGAFAAYWVERKKLQHYDAEILLKEKKILSSRVRLENVKRELKSEKAIKGTGAVKETIFVQAGKEFFTVDVNNPEHFENPPEAATEICLKSFPSKCYPFKEEQGKKVLNLSQQHIQEETLALKAAKTDYEKLIYTEEVERNQAINGRLNLLSKVTKAEKDLDKKKNDFLAFLKDPKNSMTEEFLDDLLQEGNKQHLVGSSQVDPLAPDTKEQLLAALEVMVFGKNSYGLLKNKQDEYLAKDNQYNQLLMDVNQLQVKYKLQAPSLQKVQGPAAVIVDLPQRVPASEDVSPAPESVKEDIEINTSSIIESKVNPLPATPVEDFLIKDIAPMYLEDSQEETLVEETAKEEEKIEDLEELCRKEATAKLLELLKDDKSNILGKQFTLTALKTALYLKQGKAVSLEAMVNREQQTLVSDEKVQALKKIYQDHGMGGSVNSMELVVNKIKQKKFNYYSLHSRMTNAEASHFYLLLSKSDSSVKFGMEDAAVAWAFGQLNRHPKGSVAYNKMSISTQVNKMMGVEVAGGTNLSVSDIEKKIKKEEKEIDETILTSLKTLSESCQQMMKDDCLVMNDIKQEAFIQLMQNMLKPDLRLDADKIEGHYLEVKDFIGKTNDKDLIDLGKGKLRGNYSSFSSAELQRVHLAAGKTIHSGNQQSIQIQDKCYETFHYQKNDQVLLLPVKCR
jgi:hypothetical protein